MPAVSFSTRIFAVNVLQLVNGTGKLLHLDKTWDSRWNMRILLNHIVSLLINPNFSLIPPDMMHVLNAWLVSNGRPGIGIGESIDELKDQQYSYEDLLSSLSRIDQMHLNVLSLYICDIERFNSTVSQMTKLHASKNPIAHLLNK